MEKNYFSTLLDENLCKHGFRKNKTRSKIEIRDDFFNENVLNARKGETINYKTSSPTKEMANAFSHACIDEAPHN